MFVSDFGSRVIGVMAVKDGWVGVEKAVLGCCFGSWLAFGSRVAS